MSYNIVFKSSVSKDIHKLDKTKAKEILEKIQDELSENAPKNPKLKGKFSGLRKYRIGDYRVIYSIIDQETVLILRIAHRKESYK